MECTEPKVDYSTDADVIAFSIYTQTAKTTYRIAEKFRKMGKVVIFGGPHLRGQVYKEALDKCDVVAVSISEEQWVNILDRISSGEIAPGSEKAVYNEDLKNEFRFPGDMYKTINRKKWYQTPSIPLSYGCPYSCDFCSPFMGGKYITRAIDVIYKEMETVRGDYVFIPDATFGLNKKHTIETMEAIAPLGKKIMLETSLRSMQDMELLKAMAHGGVIGISIGVESLSTKLNKHGGGDIKKILEKIVNDAHDFGIAVEGNFILGLDNDTEEIFDEIYDFYRNSNIDLIIPGLLLPYPNTKLFSDLARERRIIDTDWDHYNYLHAVFKPKRMSIEQLLKGYIRLLDNISDPEIVYKKTVEFYRRNGFIKETGVTVVHNIIRMFESIQDKRSINDNYLVALPRLKEQEANSIIS
jgi:radical SAM superfamily enzyme YgiQ (UPF0313 family)